MTYDELKREAWIAYGGLAILATWAAIVAHGANAIVAALLAFAMGRQAIRCFTAEDPNEEQDAEAEDQPEDELDDDEQEDHEPIPTPHVGLVAAPERVPGTWVDVEFGAPEVKP